jgi:hypothetical protein
VENERRVLTVTIGLSARAAARGGGLNLGLLLVFLLSEVFTDDVWVGQVIMRRLEDEIGAPDGEEPADPGEDQPWVDVRERPVHVWWTRVGKGSLESLEVAVGRRNQVGFVGGDDDGGGNRGTEDGEDSEY